MSFSHCKVCDCDFFPLLVYFSLYFLPVFVQSCFQLSSCLSNTLGTTVRAWCLYTSSLWSANSTLSCGCTSRRLRVDSHTLETPLRCSSSSFFSPCSVVIVSHLFKSVVTTPSFGCLGWWDAKFRYWSVCVFFLYTSTSHCHLPFW